MQITTEYSFWFLGVAILVSLVVAGIIYFKNKRNNHLSNSLLKILSFIRFLVLLVIAFLLLKPVLFSFLQKEEKPVIVIAQDNSESIIIHSEVPFYKDQYLKDLYALKSSLSEKYRVDFVSFGERISYADTVDYTEKLSNLSSVITEVNTTYKYDNLGALILASDGIFNNGENPMYTSWNSLNPIYTIALGDTSSRKDLVIEKVWSNKIAFLGNTFPLEIDIEAKLCKNEKAKLTVESAGKILFTEEIYFISSDDFKTRRVNLEAETAGIQKYTIRLTNLEDEVTYVNNVKQVYVDVLEAKQKILILAQNPHPDVGALKRSILRNKHYDADVQLLEGFDGNLKPYSLVVLHGITTNETTKRLLSTIEKDNAPICFVLTNTSNISYFNKIQSGVQISKNQMGSFNSVQASYNTDFSLFLLNAENAQANLGDYPPLSSSFGEYTIKGSERPLLNQKIGSVPTNYPLWTFTEVQGRKIGYILGEGTWRWPLHEYRKQGTTELFDELVSKTIQYLALKENKNQLQISTKDIYLENEQIVFNAQLFNETFQLVNEPGLKLKLTNEKGEVFPFEFSKLDDSYRLDIGNLPPGAYQYSASAPLGGKILSEKGAFLVKPVQLEETNTVANYGLLKQLAETNGGKMFGAHHLEELKQELLQNNNLKTVVKKEKDMMDLIEKKWLFFMIVLLLSTEWFIRKINSLT